MKDVMDAVSSRIKAPYFGYAVLAFLGWNGAVAQTKFKTSYPKPSRGYATAAV